MYDFTPLQLFYSAFRCPATWTPAGVGAGRVGVGVVRLKGDLSFRADACAPSLP
jgi:hypothetical protein